MWRMCVVVMDGLFSGGWGAGFSRVFQVEYRGDGGDGAMAGYYGGEVHVLQ